MILRRTNLTGSLVEGLYKSSNILYSSYNLDNKKMTVLFSNGSKYIYEDVSFKNYKKFENSDSQGKELRIATKDCKYHSAGKIDTLEYTEAIQRLLGEGEGDTENK